ncbi:hypothetical protein TNCV_362041 [Trichonephila clavipes]|nr:hypothetical protein TNCV_362041 [Trichonephila clavipes]
MIHNSTYWFSTPQDVLPQNWGRRESQNVESTAGGQGYNQNNRYILAPSHDEFRELQSDIVQRRQQHCHPSDIVVSDAVEPVFESRSRHGCL